MLVLLVPGRYYPRSTRQVGMQVQPHKSSSAIAQRDRLTSRASSEVDRLPGLILWYDPYATATRGRRRDKCKPWPSHGRASHGDRDPCMDLPPSAPAAPPSRTTLYCTGQRKRASHSTSGHTPVAVRASRSSRSTEFRFQPLFGPQGIFGTSQM